MASSTDDLKRQFSEAERENWNIDRTVDYPVMLIGAMGKTSASWVPLAVSANGALNGNG